MAKLFNSTKNLNITKELVIAKGLQRLKGLMWKEKMNANEALLIPYCNSIHTFFMNFSIDVIFLDKNKQVQKVLRNVKPNRIIFPVLSSTQVVEMATGSIDTYNIEVGDTLNVED